MPACWAEIQVVLQRSSTFVAMAVRGVERLNFPRGRSACAVGCRLDQVNGVNTVLQQLLNAILVEDGLLKSCFDLPAPLFAFLRIPDGSGLLQAHLKVTHEGLHRGLFIHEQRSLPKHINACPWTRR